MPTCTLCRRSPSALGSTVCAECLRGQHYAHVDGRHRRLGWWERRWRRRWENG